MTALPPSARSLRGAEFSAAAAEGRFVLQVCGVCANVCWPAREKIPPCRSQDIRWSEVPDGGRLISETVLHHSFNDFFRARLPWRIGTVQLDAGPPVLAHLHAAVGIGSRVRMIACIDPSGQGVMAALPDQDLPDEGGDRQMNILKSKR